MPWERRPAWMYLPHLDDGEVATKGEAGSGTSTGVGGQPASGDSALLGEAATVEVYASTHRDGRDQGVPAGERFGAEPSQVRSSVGHIGPPMPRCAGASSDNGEAAEIRGRGSPPRASVHLPTVGHAQAAEATPIRGHDQVPGPSAGIGRDRAQQRLDARNSHLAQSLADHADRVARRDMQGDRQRGASAAERIAALRRRVSARRGTAVMTEARTAAQGAHRSVAFGVGPRDERHEGGGEDGLSRASDAEQAEGGAQVGTPAGNAVKGGAKDLVSEFVTEMAVDAGSAGAGTPIMGAAWREGETPGSNEDQEMHLFRLHGGRIHDAAACLAWSSSSACSRGAAHDPHAAEGEGRQTVWAPSERQGYVVPPSSAVEDAASRVAWHSVAPSM